MATGRTEEIRPSDVQVPDRVLDDLRRRIGATRWPTTELMAGRSQRSCNEPTDNVH